MRRDKRQWDQLRSVKLIKEFISSPSASVLIKMGNTKVLCAASLEFGVPAFLERRFRILSRYLFSISTAMLFLSHCIAANAVVPGLRRGQEQCRRRMRTCAQDDMLIQAGKGRDAAK